MAFSLSTFSFDSYFFNLSTCILADFLSFCPSILSNAIFHDCKFWLLLLEQSGQSKVSMAYNSEMAFKPPSSNSLMH